MRPPVPRFVYLIYLLDHIPGVVAILGMPLHFHPHDHGRLALDETPYPAFDTSHIMFTYVLFFYRIFFLIYTQRVVQHSLRVGMVEEVLLSQ